MEQQQPDIMLLTETKLNKKHKLGFKNYIIYRTDRVNSVQGGGTAILISKKIQAEPQFIPMLRDNKCLEATVIKLRRDNISLFIISGYANHKNNKHCFINELNSLLTFLKVQHLNNYFVLAGDLNARSTEWGDHDSNLRGDYLKKWLDDDGLIFRARLIPPCEPTYTRTGTYLDLCIIDHRLNVGNLPPENSMKTIEYDSDHRVTTLNVKFDIPIECPVDNQIKVVYDYKATNWQAFAEFLQTSSTTDIPATRNLNRDEINEFFQAIDNEIITAIEHMTPQKDVNIDSVLKYVNNKIRKLQRVKSKLLTIRRKINTGKIKVSMKVKMEVDTTIAEIKEQITAEFRETISNYWKKQVQAIDYRRSENFFPKINKLLTRKPPLTIETLNISTDNESIISRAHIAPNEQAADRHNLVINNPIDKLNLIGATFESINAPKYLNQTSRLTHIICRISTIITRV
ncbi:uncharacterized protein [Chelonus insularis]|uniref:uncharacterized protein n=1 Tax=Chelonus insularis TaxID=460826 RepID=UPI00158C8404|nr:uncharacterized protein LOC118073095 [Chelonus insularis]